MTAWHTVLRYAMPIAKRCGVTPIVLLSARRTGRVPHGRDELAWALRRVEGWPNARIADELGRDRWWVSNAVSRHQRRVSTEALDRPCQASRKRLIRVIAAAGIVPLLDNAPTTGART